MTREPEDFERWLGDVATSRPPRAPEGFTDRVMARVALEPREMRDVLEPGVARPWLRTLPASVGGDPLPWWTRVFAQPACALGFVVVGVAYVLRASLEQAPAAVNDLAARAVATLAPWMPVLVRPFQRFTELPGGTIALALAAVPLTALAAYACYAVTASLAHPARSLASAPPRRTGS